VQPYDVRGAFHPCLLAQHGVMIMELVRADLACGRSRPRSGRRDWDPAVAQRSPPDAVNRHARVAGGPGSARQDRGSPSTFSAMTRAGEPAQHAGAQLLDRGSQDTDAVLM
jgi:hypothetical protein